MSEPKDDSEKHGYKAPPKASQFKKGQSGNPKGRPKGAKNNKTVFENLAATLIDGKIPGSDDKVTLREGVIAQLASKALGGDARSMNKFIDTMHTYDEENKSYCRETELAAIGKILEFNRKAHINAAAKFSAADLKVISDYLKSVDEEFKKFALQISAIFDKNNFARPELLDDMMLDIEPGSEEKIESLATSTAPASAGLGATGDPV